MNFDALVIGSKPGAEIPDLQIKKVYTANGAAERGANYLEKFPESELTCLVGELEFEKNINVKKRILDSKPSKIIVRGEKISLPSELDKKCKKIFLNFRQQQKIQSIYLKGGLFSIICAEYFRELKILQKLIYLSKKIRNFEFQGVSTGFFSILMALQENPNAKILITGIGMSGGKQFYKNERNKTFDYTSRARVDRYLVKKLKKEFLNNIYTTDEDLNRHGNFKLWK